MLKGLNHMESVNCGIKGICFKYPCLIPINERTIRGILPIDKVVKDEHIIDFFEIEIDFSSNVPKVFELKNKTNDFPHKYVDGRLCLETDLTQLIYLKEHTYLEWLDYYVVNYFCSFLYYKKYKCFPFGERTHFVGDFISFSDYVQIDHLSMYKVLEYILNRRYRGHDLCPCGSNKRIRNCHKSLILKFQRDDDLFEEIERIYNITKAELIKFEKKRKYI